MPRVYSVCLYAHDTTQAIRPDSQQRESNPPPTGRGGGARGCPGTHATPRRLPAAQPDTRDSQHIRCPASRRADRRGCPGLLLFNKSRSNVLTSSSISVSTSESRQSRITIRIAASTTSSPRPSIVRAAAPRRRTTESVIGDVELIFNLTHSMSTACFATTPGR